MCYRIGVFFACFIATVGIASADGSAYPPGWNGFYPGMRLQEAAEVIQYYQWPESDDSSALDPKKPRFYLAGVAIETKPEIYSTDQDAWLGEGVPSRHEPGSSKAKVTTVRFDFRSSKNQIIKAYIKKTMSLYCNTLPDSGRPGGTVEDCQYEDQNGKVELFLYSNSTRRSSVEWSSYSVFLNSM